MTGHPASVRIYLPADTLNCLGVPVKKKTPCILVVRKSIGSAKLNELAYSGLWSISPCEFSRLEAVSVPANLEGLSPNNLHEERGEVAGGRAGEGRPVLVHISHLPPQVRFLTVVERNLAS